MSMELSIKNIIVAFFVIVVVGVVGWWGSNTILDLSHQYGWDMFVSQEEIKNQRDSKEIFSDMIVQVNDCLIDESNIPFDRDYNTDNHTTRTIFEKAA